MRTLFALMAAAMLLPTAANAGDMYYRNTITGVGHQVWAVPDTGEAPYLVFSADDLSSASPHAVTHFNHVGSNGQALVVTEQGIDGTNVFLYYKDDFGIVYKKQVTALGNDANDDVVPMRPVLGQDDGFFSLFCRNSNQTENYIYRVNVSVDEIFLDGYQPPTSFTDDLRVQLVAARNAVAPDRSSKLASNLSHHTWSPDGTRLAYNVAWIDAKGVYKVSVQVQDMFGNIVTLYTWDMFGAAGGVAGHLRWSPIDDRILGYYYAESNAGSIFRLDANAPGFFAWVLKQNVVTLSKTSTRYERNEWPIWRPDGNLIGASHRRVTETRKGANVTWTTEFWSSALLPLSIITTAQKDQEKIPIGWTATP